MEQNAKIDDSKLELSPLKPVWVVPIDESSFDQQMKDIFCFFVMESPCPDVSTLGKTLNGDYGWNKGDYKKDGWLEKRILSIMGLETDRTFYIGKRREDMKDTFLKADMCGDFYIKHNANRVCMLQNGCFIMDFCRHIRNSFAHFRFAVAGDNSEILIFENGIKYKGRFETKARMVIKKDTLIEMIKMIKDGVQIKNNELLDEEKRIDDSIVKLITDKEIKSQDSIAKELSIKMQVVMVAITRLKKANRIQYNHHKKCWETIQDSKSAA